MQEKYQAANVDSCKWCNDFLLMCLVIDTRDCLLQGTVPGIVKIDVL